MTVVLKLVSTFCIMPICCALISSKTGGLYFGNKFFLSQDDPQAGKHYTPEGRSSNCESKQPLQEFPETEQIH